MLTAAAATEKGIHLRNQDAYLCLPGRGLFAVADGVTTGGRSERASKAAIDAVRNSKELAAAFAKAHARIRQLKDAGSTTLTACTIRGTRLEFVHVGDSALLLVRDRVLQLTREHAQPGSNLLTQVVGKGGIRPQQGAATLRKGDILLLLTDGVTKHLDEEELLALARTLRVQLLPKALLARARTKPKLYEDDKTAVAVRIG
ncbi:MAG: protein phosphatase 2C domain-containing protein [Candidatus Aenigmarchaeota archaeon]|nr:protein phosphatase 2C domain-containing protein [Candidatus Aenigmarchaeota archaeon]